MKDNYPMGVDGSSGYFNQPEPPECPNCWMQMEEEWNYCPHCGHDMREEREHD